MGRSNSPTRTTQPSKVALEISSARRVRGHRRSPTRGHEGAATSRSSTRSLSHTERLDLFLDVDLACIAHKSLEICERCRLRALNRVPQRNLGFPARRDPVARSGRSGPRRPSLEGLNTTPSFQLRSSSNSKAIRRGHMYSF